MFVRVGDELAGGKDHVFIPGSCRSPWHERLTRIDPIKAPAHPLSAARDVVVLDTALVPSEVISFNAFADVGRVFQNRHQPKVHSLIVAVRHDVNLPTQRLFPHPLQVVWILEQVADQRSITGESFFSVEEPMMFQLPIGRICPHVGIDHGTHTTNFQRFAPHCSGEGPASRTKVGSREQTAGFRCRVPKNLIGEIGSAVRDRIPIVVWCPVIRHYFCIGTGLISERPRMKTAKLRTTLLLVICPIASACGQNATTLPTWRLIEGRWPDTTNQVRAMISSNGQLYIGVAGTVANSAQVWKLINSGWVRHAEFKPWKVAVLQTDTAGNLYVGTGTPHSAELPGMGHAKVWTVDSEGKKTQLRTFKDRDIAYSMVWFQGKLHVGTVTEDLPGTAEIWRFDDPG